ncbi:unnamed protein product [Effrenium voratum]|nr:unnamed protein product [Effrenium voratum]
MAERYTAPAKGDGDLEERVAQLEAKLKSLTLALGAELQDRPEANGNEETEAKATMDPSHTVLTLNSLASRASAASQQESHVEDDFQLMMSVWDAVICASMGSSSAPGWEVGRADQVLVFLLFCFNITMQTVFILGIATTMNGNPYVGASIPTMKYQRLFDGHDYNQMDRSTMQSRVQKVCTGTWHNRLSATSTNTFQYLQMDGSGVPGQFISLVAMTIWVLSMGKEIRATLDQLAALIMLPNNSQARKSQVISKEEEEVGDTTAGVITDEGGYVIRVMRLPHKIALVLFVYIPRLAIAFTVLWVGTMYLADTAVVSDLILNACALEIVHSVDELVFESVASRKLHQMVEKTRIRYVRGRSLISALLGPENANDKQGVESKSQLLMSARLGMLLVVLVIAYVSHLMPLVNMAEEAYKSICGHEVDFAYVTHPAAGLPVFAAIQSDSSNEVATCYYAAQYEVLSIRVGFDPVHFPRNETLRVS